jgi:hypothetical protein
MNIRQSKYLSAAIFALMILAVLVKAALPAGFMPSTEGGFTKLVICSGVGEKTILVPDDSGVEQNHDDSSNDICSYQILTSQKSITPTVIEPAPPMTLDKVAYNSSPALHISSTSYLSFTARGPPAA